MRSLDRIYQLAFVVDELAAGIEQWVRTANAGPFYVFEHFTFASSDYDDLPAPDISIALGFSGPTNIELIEVHADAGPLFAGGASPRPHHIAQLTNDFEMAMARLEAAGKRTFAGVFAPATRMAYIDTRATLGLYSEIVEYGPGVEAMLAQMEAEARGWNGRDPIRHFV
jgi:hypothetical protein